MPRRLSAFCTALLLCASLQAAGKLPFELSKAAIEGDVSVASKLVASGEKVNDVDWWGWTPLLWAAYYGQNKMVDYLLEQGADPNAVTKEAYGNFKPGASVLILAAYYGHSMIVESLLAKKADRAYKDHMGKTALDYAKQWDFDKCVALLEKQPG